MGGGSVGGGVGSLEHGELYAAVRDSTCAAICSRGVPHPKGSKP